MRRGRLLKRLLSGGNTLSRKKDTERKEITNESSCQRILSLDDVGEDVQLYILACCDLKSMAALANVEPSVQVSFTLASIEVRKVDDWPILRSGQLYQSLIPFDRDRSHFQRCFYPQMRMRGANAVLMGRTKGTFIFRGSSHGDNEMTISYIDSHGNIRHNRMSFTPDGYIGAHWEDKTPYCSLVQIMLKHPELSHPLYNGPSSAADYAANLIRYFDLCAWPTSQARLAQLRGAHSRTFITTDHNKTRMKAAAFLIAICLASLVAAQQQSVKSFINDNNVLNYLLTVKNLEAAYYQQGLAAFNEGAFNAAGFVQGIRSAIAVVAAQEANHARTLSQILISRGWPAIPVCTYTFHSATPGDFINALPAFGSLGTEAYVSAAVGLTNKDFLNAVAGIATVEARHASFASFLVQGNPFLEGPFTTARSYTELLQIIAVSYVNTNVSVSSADLDSYRWVPASSFRFPGTNVTDVNGEVVSYFTANTSYLASDANVLNYLLIVESLEASFYQTFSASYTPANILAAYPGLNSTLAERYSSIINVIAAHELVHASALHSTLQSLSQITSHNIAPACSCNWAELSPALADSTRVNFTTFLSVAYSLESLGVRARHGAGDKMIIPSLTQFIQSINTVDAGHTSFLAQLFQSADALNHNLATPVRAFDTPFDSSDAIQPSAFFAIMGPAFSSQCVAGISVPADGRINAFNDANNNYAPYTNSMGGSVTGTSTASGTAASTTAAYTTAASTTAASTTAASTTAAITNTSSTSAASTTNGGMADGSGIQTSEESTTTVSPTEAVTLTTNKGSTDTTVSSTSPSTTGTVVTMTFTVTISGSVPSFSDFSTIMADVLGCSKVDITAASRKRDVDQSFRLTQSSLSQLGAANDSLHRAVREAQISPDNNPFSRSAAQHGITPFSVSSIKSESTASDVSNQAGGDSTASTQKSNTGAIVGGVVGGIIGLLIVVGVVVAVLTMTKKRKDVEAAQTKEEPVERVHIGHEMSVVVDKAEEIAPHHPHAVDTTSSPVAAVKSKEERERALRAKVVELRQQMEGRTTEMDELLLETQTREVMEKQRQLMEENAQTRQHIELIEKRISELAE
ncbi:hypothetical protein PROFUN_03520 [Planoprotostelium fungivorum]|uniref:Uncharacterized protein n=1 Tax=Planoprotostelium fungivorum TaxID=1890364 RepID=A0A2P6MNF4_9EUKA|nr:hypothetical protein PROFUN_03520 [Planoprotostelium fungivorum]